MKEYEVESAVNTVVKINPEHLTTFLEAIKPKIVWDDSKLTKHREIRMMFKYCTHPQGHHEFKNVTTVLKSRGANFTPVNKVFVEARDVKRVLKELCRQTNNHCDH